MIIEKKEKEEEFIKKRKEKMNQKRHKRTKEKLKCSK
jgi:hypothetical protein